MAFVLRDLTDVAACRAVVDLQVAVWGADAETVPASVLVVSAKRGGILIGAYDDSERELLGFVWSMPGWREGRPTHWSHMLGVIASARGRGVGEALKRAQRERAGALGIDLIEWTFDPLQAENAHLNISRLGAVASTYLVDAYGEMSGPLHRGTATDRIVAEWWIHDPRVTTRLHEAASGGQMPSIRAAGAIDAPAVLFTETTGAWVACTGAADDLQASRVRVPVPPRFTEMQQQATNLATAWRLATRQAFTACFARGYTIVDFFRDREGGGQYLLAIDDAHPYG